MWPIKIYFKFINLIILSIDFSQDKRVVCLLSPEKQTAFSTGLHVRPRRLRSARAVRSEPSQCSLYVAKDSNRLQVDSEDCDQTSLSLCWGAHAILYSQPSLHRHSLERKNSL